VIFSIVVDPIAVNLVASMDKPGSNVTGITSLDPQQASKQFELLREAFPGIKRVAILSDQTIPGADERGLAPIDRANEAAARALGLEPQIVKVKSSADLEAAIAAMIKERAEALLVLEVPVPFTARKQVAELAIKNRLPTMFPGGQADAGGVITYGTSVTDTWRRFAAFADKIFKGTRPADLPVGVITKRELVFNLQTAQAVGAWISAFIFFMA
jgi:putative ABC transport system substrate-binding protein